MANEANSIDRYECPHCYAAAEFVRSHKRQQTSGTAVQVSEHFRYSNCNHGPTTDVSDSSGGGGGGGGGGESELHVRRKLAALHEALDIFPAAEYDKEANVGCRRADALLEFKDGHEKYGKGLAIEYQHKNEQKDIKAVEKEYASEEYTTVWLWEDQFSFETNVPDIDLFDGRVYTPWPDAVPEQDNWTGEGLDTEARSKWAKAHQKDLTDSAVPAKLPKEWFDEKAQCIWRSQRWHELFSYWPGYESDSLRRELIQDMDLGSIDQLEIVLPPDWYDEQAKQIWRSQAWEKLFDPPEKHTDIWCYSKVPATVVKHWVEPTQKQYWNSTEWRERFQGTHDFLVIDCTDFSLEAKVPFEKYIESSDGARLINAIRDAYDSGRFQRAKGTVRRCPHCDVCEVHDPVHDGEIKRVTTCCSCGEWYTVWDAT